MADEQLVARVSAARDEVSDLWPHPTSSRILDRAAASVDLHNEDGHSVFAECLIEVNNLDQLVFRVMCMGPGSQVNGVWNYDDLPTMMGEAIDAHNRRKVAEIMSS